MRGLGQHARWAFACAAVVVAGCGRSQLEFAPAPAPLVPSADGSVVERTPLPPDAAPDLVPDRAPDRPPDLPMERAPDLRPDLPVELAPPPPPPPPTPPPPPPPPPPVDAGPACHPQPETCNGLDDDCNGKVDDGLPPIPCPNGGERYCVSGAYSECPRRCEVCVPGGQRECFTAYCTYWGTQTCASDGRSWGPCKESLVPAECKAITDTAKYSAELERCCVAQGLCCRDDFNLDGDGTTEMVGRCDSVTCGP
ncbi:MAG TPA: hypothetical protein VHL80_05900 [Polyangia bacterium]|nr:hypothetical protein [Polyangia bacterium]